MIQRQNGLLSNTTVIVGEFLVSLPYVSYPYVFLIATVAFVVGIGSGLLYRLLMDEKAPWHVPVIIGVGAIGLWLNTASTMVYFVERATTEEPLFFQDVATNSAAILASSVAAIVGARVGDQLAPNVRALSGATETEIEVSKIVRTIGRFITVTVPKVDQIDDIDGYEPVPDETKQAFAGVELLFPRGLTVDELHQRVVDRLRSDYGVGHVDLELDETGAITHLAVGRRAAGIGPTIPPRKGAIALNANPAPDASPGDRVHLWTTTDDGARRIARAELRATTDDVATLLLDVHRIGAVDQSKTYDLVTLRSKTGPEIEFASLLRTANETMDSVRVAPETPIAGLPIGALKLPVVAVRDPDRTLHTVPPREHVCEPGSTMYVVGRHDELRKFRVAAGVESIADVSTQHLDSGDNDIGTGPPPSRSRPYRAILQRFRDAI